ncbi:hypothetical protein EJB05_51462, partial [Eragrostis curvula]
MGLCCSKKQPPPGATSKQKPGKVAAAIADDKAKKTVPQPKIAADKNAVRAKAAAVAAAGEGEEKKKKRAPQEEQAPKQLSVVVVPSAPVRTSSCTKEEVDAILIQCGRLSRSSSGTGRAASGETGGEGSGHRRRRSGSKRSYDFDQERKAAAGGGGGDEECDWERQGVPVSRPSPHRGSPQRKRSGSRERSGGGGGSRRASRSPGRRSEGGVSSAAMAGTGGGDRARQQQQPGKLVSVPAREKGRAPSPAAASGMRCASPRSSSPARMMAAVGNENAGGRPATAGPTPALSRSSSRKAEQSPYRRNPMSELDENALRNNVATNAKPQKKSTEETVVVAHQKAADRGKEPTGTASGRSGKEKPEVAENATVATSEARPHSTTKTSATRTASVAAESLTQRPAISRSRRASRDFDQSSNNSYASQILEDIQSYHEQLQSTSAGAAPPATPSFTLPACVAKACSILDAVADLNSSSSSDNRTFDYAPGRSADDRASVNTLSGAADTRGVEPSARGRGLQHVPAVRDLRAEAAEPQESAGSNSVSGIPWTPSWEPASVESSDRTCSAGDEVVDQAVQAGGSHGAPSPMNRPRQSSKQRPAQPEPSGRSRAGSGNGNSLSRGRSAHRGSASAASGRSGVRTVSAAS